MNLIAVGDQKTALSLLKNLGLAENSRDLAALKLLNFYLQSQNADYSEVQKKEWLNLKNISPAALEKINDPFFCLVYGKIAMALEKQKRYMEAFESYRQAYAFSDSREDSLRLLESMLTCLEKMDQKTDAAALAMKEYELFFNNSNIDHAVSLKIAQILIRGDMKKELVNIL